MKIITTSQGVFGAFNNIEILSDRYHCDGGDYPFSVIGTGVISDYVPVPPVPNVAAINAPIYAQLAAIDQKSIRAIREGDQDRIDDLETQAVLLRGMLVR